MTIKNKIEGTISLLSPMHCATIDTGPKLKGSENITRTHTRYILTRRGSKLIPYFPGNDLRGRLRRHAARLVLDHITATAQVRVELYAGLMAAAIDANPEMDQTVEEALRARDNVYMGLFGGGRRVLRSRYAANDLVPVLEDTVECGSVPKVYGENWNPVYTEKDTGKVTAVSGHQLLQTRTSGHTDDVVRVMNVNDLQKYVADAVNAVAAKQAETLAAKNARTDSKAAAQAGTIETSEIEGKKDVGNLFSIESVMAGTRMYFLVDIADDASDAHVGLLLLALRNLVREQSLGGCIRSGFGRFSADLTITRNGQEYQVFNAQENAAGATLTDDVQTAFVTPALAAIATLTAESMMEFFTARKPAKEKKLSSKKQEVPA